MYGKKRIVIVLSIFLFLLPQQTVVAKEVVNRIGGTDRYQTASQVAETNWGISKNVILVSGVGYADSINSSVLAKKLDAPILMTEPNSMNAYTKNALECLKPDKIYIVGGTASISSQLEKELKKNYEVVRLGGATRYDTNMAVAGELIKQGENKDRIIAVSGSEFSDAISTAAVAAATSQILILVNNNQPSIQYTINFATNSDVTVIGTENSVSRSLYSSLKADRRINGGVDRFETNLNVISTYSEELKSDRIYIANATGPEGYADALAASSLAGRYSSPLVLIDTENSLATENAINYIKYRFTENTDIYVVGGKSVIPDRIIEKIKDELFY